MSRKETSIDIKGFESTFLVQKTSRLQANITGSGYYSKIKTSRGTSFSNTFVSSFNSQVNPTILPGSIQGSQVPTPIEISYILSELDESMLTEDSNNLIIE